MHGTRRAVDACESFEAGEGVESLIDLVDAIVDLAVELDDLRIDLARPFPCSPDKRQGEGPGHTQHDGDQSYDGHHDRVHDASCNAPVGCRCANIDRPGIARNYSSPQATGPVRDRPKDGSGSARPGGVGPAELGSSVRSTVPIACLMDTLSIAASGVHSAELRLLASAHNVTNLMTELFRPVRITQTEALAGGSTARLDQAARPAPVDLVHQTVELSRASAQQRASLRLLVVEADLRGQLANLLA